MGCTGGNLPGAVARGPVSESYGLLESPLFPQSDRTECVEVYLDDMDTVPSLCESQVFVPLCGGAECMSLQVIGFNPSDIITPQ